MKNLRLLPVMLLVCLKSAATQDPITTVAPDLGPATDARTKVVFTCKCDDIVGSRFATAFRDRLAVSPRFVQTSREFEPPAAGQKIGKFNWILSVVSLAVEDYGKSDSRTALSIVIRTGFGIQLNQEVLICGTARIEDCAATTLASLDQQVQGWNSSAQ